MTTSPSSETRMTLYDMERELLALHEQLSDALDDEQDPMHSAAVLALTKKIEQVMLGTQEKVDACKFVMDALQATVEARKRRMEDDRRKIESAENAVARFKSYLLSVMQAHRLERLKGLNYTFWTQKGPPHVDGNILPADPALVRVIPEKREPNKMEIARRLKAGEEVEGWRLVEGDVQLRVK